jgi:hypothetical protein
MIPLDLFQFKPRPAQLNCDRLGMPRNLFLEVSIYPYELVQTPDRVFPRELPKDPDPQWMGYSVGNWEGDIFVVKSLGFGEDTWLDHFGNPLEERYHRVDRGTAYTKPWVSERKILKLAPKAEIQELFCVPSEDQRFNQLVRDSGSGIVIK